MRFHLGVAEEKWVRGGTEGRDRRRCREQLVVEILERQTAVGQPLLHLQTLESRIEKQTSTV